MNGKHLTLFVSQKNTLKYFWAFSVICEKFLSTNRQNQWLSYRH